MAAAESYFDGEKGIRYQEFMECLRASVSYDRRHTGPKHFGQNLNRGAGRRTRRDYQTYVTYEGTLYGEDPR